MTIAQAFNKIAVDNGGTASTSGTIAGAIDALNDALAGSDQEQATTIEQAVELLGAHISGGGGGGATKHTITCKVSGEAIGSIITDEVSWDNTYKYWAGTGASVTEALPGTLLALNDETYGIEVVTDSSGRYLASEQSYTTMPDTDIIVNLLAY